MNKYLTIAKNLLITSGILSLCCLLCLLIRQYFEDAVLVPALFILGAFLTAVLTEGYGFGILSALLSVLIVNFAFTFPFFAFNFTITENFISACIMLIVTTVTCGLTTKLKKQEMIKAESEKERMRANLLRAVSHDLRTPLTTIYGSSSALLENYDSFSDAQKKQILNGIREDSQWLSRMVENLLSITKLDNGKVKILKSDTVLDELIDSVLVKFAKRYPHQEVHIRLPEDFITIPMDAILIEQVILNILENAVQHAQGMTLLSLKVFTISGKAVFEIEDNGCGIEPDKLSTVFSGYYSQDTVPPDGRKNNAGIGLSVCASIIKAHDGEIHAENLREGGCIFRFTLNLEE